MALQIEGCKLEYSNGFGRGGRFYAYLRPIIKSSNRSRRIGGWTIAEIESKAQKVYDKWYRGVISHYTIIGDPYGFTIASNSAENALKEYWKISDKKSDGSQIALITTINK